MRATLITLAVALLLHGAVLLLGGLLIPGGPERAAAAEEYEIVADPEPESKPEEVQPEEQPVETTEETLTDQVERAPDVAALAALTAPVDLPALAPLTLAELEGALGGAVGAVGDGFGSTAALASGGRIGGLGSAMAPVAEFDAAAMVGELDDKPRAVFQSTPTYPPDLYRRKVEGSVELVFRVDTSGKVQEPKVVRSTDPAFERPALEAVRMWRFEPGRRSGEKVAFKMKIPILFRVKQT